MPEKEKSEIKKLNLNSDVFDILEKSFKEITNLRKKPLLVMFYSDKAGRILPYDIQALEGIFDDFLKNENKEGFMELDLLIHTLGGEAHTSYRLIQMIRSYCKKLNVLVATHAHSGGTLIAFGADIVEMGRTATLSPIDLQVGEGFALLSVEKYTEFVENISKEHKFKDEKNKCNFVTEMTKFLIEEVGPSQLGELFRLRSLTGLHSKALLHNYMLKNVSNKEELADNIITKFTRESPTHNFLMDYELVDETGMAVRKMNPNVYKLLRILIDKLILLKRGGFICDFYPLSTSIRKPFFKIYPMEVDKNGKKKR